MSKIPLTTHATPGDARISSPEGWKVLLGGRVVRPITVLPKLSSANLRWDGVTLESYDLPASFIPDHEHPIHYLSLQTTPPIRVEWSAGGRSHAGVIGPGTIELIPRGGRDQVWWGGASARVVVTLHPRLLTQAIEETAHQDDVELIQHMDLRDRHIASLMLALQADLEDGAPAGRLYGESLGTAFAVYLVRRYAAAPPGIQHLRGGLPKYRLRRVLDFVASNLDRNLSLTELASLSGLSPHYFATLFQQSMGTSPHRYVLQQRIERAKELMRNRTRTILDVALFTGFEDQSHFTKVFRRAVGLTPTQYRAEL